MTANRKRIADFAFQHRLPSMYEWRAAVEAGGLMSYGPSRADLSRRAAIYVDKILKGARPADLPVEQPMKFELVINLTTAEALGLTIPPTCSSKPMRCCDEGHRAPRTARARHPWSAASHGRTASGESLPDRSAQSGPPIEPNPGLAAFRQGLRDLGYVEGQNLVIEDRHAEGNPERLRDLAAELVRLKVDVIVAGGGAGIRAAQRATQTIPIVMAVTGDAVRDGFVASLAHPGGNITGVSWLAEELPGKRLELLKETVPQSAHIAVLANPARPGGSEAVMSSLVVF